MEKINPNAILFIVLFAVIFYIYYKKIVLIVLNKPDLKMNPILERESLFKRFDLVVKVLATAQETAYTKIFRDYIMIYSSSGFKLNKDEIHKLYPEYLNIVFSSCGPAILEDLKNIYGDLDSVSILLINDFIQRVEQDEITITAEVENEQDYKNDKETNE